MPILKFTAVKNFKLGFRTVVTTVQMLLLILFLHPNMSSQVKRVSQVRQICQMRQVSVSQVRHFR